MDLFVVNYLGVLWVENNYLCVILKIFRYVNFFIFKFNGVLFKIIVLCGFNINNLNFLM